MRSADQQLIRELSVFREMKQENFDALLSAAYFQRFPEGVTLIHEGDLPDFLHIVVEGMVELFGACGERQTTLDVIRPVTTFILAAVIRDDVYLKSARTLAPSQILMIPATAVREVFDRDAAFARAVVGELADRYRCVVRELKNQKLRTGLERLAAWILQAERQQGGDGRVRLTYDKRTLASQLGMTAENLSRNLAALAQHGVSSRGREIIIGNRDALETCARPDALIDA
ncbi:MAG TPA: cyclic nucleotide-binding domain-containing protein [Xanthobacteraceae bacterium]|nr:cyclic nucleotide-binding domain-containing protein [Xanthobacteraceae bacterium]